MKFQKGKLSTSNAVVIGILLVVLYLVIPRGSQKKQSDKADQSMTAGASVDSSSNTAESTPASSMPVQQQSAAPGNPGIAAGTEAIGFKVRPLTEIDLQKLQEIAGRSPFCTTIVRVRSSGSTELETPVSARVEPASDETSVAATLERNSSVKLIYSSSTGRQAAILNDEVVYEGSFIADKLTVDSIHPDGVRIRRSAAFPEFDK